MGMLILLLIIVFATNAIRDHFMRKVDKSPKFQDKCPPHKLVSRMDTSLICDKCRGLPSTVSQTPDQKMPE